MKNTNDKVLAKLDKICLTLVDLSSAVEEVVDRMDTRSERDHENIHSIMRRLRCLEEYLGIEFRNPRREKEERYVKSKKNS